MPTPVYHITHLRNLPGIIANGIACDAAIAKDNTPVIGIAHQHIKLRRARKAVLLCKRGTLANYVPFYFAPRSPMLFTISRGNVEGYAQGQSPVLHLVSTVERITELGLPCLFTDGHADMVLSNQFDDLTKLQTQIDWKVMRSEYWSDTVEDNDRKRRRQAEFLVHDRVPWEAIVGIGVINPNAKIQAHAVITAAACSHQPGISPQPTWYY